jgi:hypothetical protein
MTHEEKVGGICPPLKTIQDFAQFVENNDLMDVKPLNGKFTWTNRRAGFAQIAVRLDRFLLSHEWKLGRFQIQSDILSLPDSDHFPISINISQPNTADLRQHKSSFKFERMWLRHPHFLPLLKQWWFSAPFVQGSRMHQFAKKMQYVKSQIKVWNQNVFKNVFK